MKSNLLDWVSRFFRYVLLGGAILYIIVYLFVVFSRIGYPFELMWQEGASVDHAIRIASGHKYYVKPSLEFVSSIYTPLYFYLSALLFKLIGIGFLPLRLISFISSLGCFLMIYLMVKRETGNHFPGILAAGLFAATYQLSGSWFDIGKPDSLFLFLLLIALYILRFNTSSGSYLLAGILISLSFLTKQTALAISLPIIAYCIILLDKRLAFSFIIPIVTIVGLGSLLLNYLHDGWFNFYVFELPRTTPIDQRPFMHFWIKDIYVPLTIALVIAIFYMLIQLINSNKKIFLFYFLVAIGMFGASWYSRYRGGGYYNVLFPAYAMISILLGLGINKLLEISQLLAMEKRNLMKIFIYLVCIAQFSSLSLVYNPFDQIPTRKDLEAGKKFINKIAQIKGEIFMSFHGYLPVMAGKKSYANQMGMRDVLTTRSKKHAKIKTELINEIKQAMREKKFSAIIIDSFEPWYPPDMEKYYIKKERIFDDETIFFPVTGMKTRPEFIYVPKSQILNNVEFQNSKQQKQKTNKHFE